MNSNTVAFYTEAGTAKGMGHLIRCYTIAQEFKRQKIKVDFFIDSDINFDDKFNDIQYFKWEDLKINSNYHIIFIDSYEANIEIYNYISLSCNTAVYIDDYKRLNYPKGTILNFAPDSKDIFYNKKDSKYNYLLGLNYIPIRDEFLNLKIEKKEQIFIMLGGFDVANLSLKIVDSLDNLSIPITIVINNKDMIESFNKYKNIEILHKPSDTKLIEAMACSSLAISTASMSVYELAFLRIPTLVIAVAKNQELGISQLIKYNIVSDYVSIKNKNWKNEIKEKVQYIFNHKDNIVENNIDGNGTKNIVTEILEL